MEFSNHISNFTKLNMNNIKGEKSLLIRVLLNGVSGMEIYNRHILKPAIELMERLLYAIKHNKFNLALTQ